MNDIQTDGGMDGWMDKSGLFNTESCDDGVHMHFVESSMLMCCTRKDQYSVSPSFDDAHEKVGECINVDIHTFLLEFSNTNCICVHVHCSY